MTNTLKCLLIFSLINLNINSQITNCIYPSTIGKYNKYEINFMMPVFSNPFDPTVIDCYAVFISPSGKMYKQNAFYFEDYNKMDNGLPSSFEVLNVNGTNGWKIRFSHSDF